MSGARPLERSASAREMDRWRPGRDYWIVETADGEAILYVVGNHRLFRLDAGTAGRLREGPGALLAEEVEEWSRLEAEGWFHTENPEVVGAADWRDGANLAINVNLTGGCNLACTYCFADGGDYGRVSGRLGADVIDGIFDLVDRECTASRVVRLEYFGGEPLLAFDRISAIVERSRAHGRAHGVRYLHRISTNLALLPPGAVELFESHGFTVSVSIDGGPDTHNRNRPRRDGGASWTATIENCRRIRRAGNGVTLVARMTWVPGPARLVEDALALWEEDIFDWFQIYPAVGSVRLDTAGSRSCAPRPAVEARAAAGAQAYLDELSGLLATYARMQASGARFRGLLEVERMVQMLLTGGVAPAFCSAGRTYFTVSPDGSIMPCHRLVGDLDFRVGTSGDGTDPASLGAWRGRVDDNPHCAGCWVRYLCGGGCRQENLVTTGALAHPSPAGCDVQEFLVTAAIRQVIARPDEYRTRDRSVLDDLFVSCGRPLVRTAGSPAEPLTWRPRFFVPA